MIAGLGGGVGLAALGSLTACASAAEAPPPPPSGRETVYPAQTTWDPLPEMTGAKGQVQIPDVKLACWDTGGSGEPVVFLHPHTGNGGVWGYQQGPFTQAGYRVISFSCRGYHQSEAGPTDRPGTLVDDVVALLGALGVTGKFHLVGLAKGGFAGFDAALSLPDRLLSCTVGSTLAGIVDPEFKKVSAAILPPQWEELPEHFKELGPSYRAAAPDAMKHWIEHAERPVVTVEQAPKNKLTWQALESVKIPTLLLTGEADLYMPPSRMRQVAGHVRDAQVAIIAESGHAPHWEQYRSFNNAVLSFIGRHRAAKG
ncbi:alpha/beta fold hydrolase [Pseudonocardia acaciae]|uniref:alpha/beta fold hydrolase n=1 Tax=Pseudonocardia acaciae TaxID=551276 RepID=UPI0014705EEC|nr:alpha/beta hydrolase [Pseudonocardia acaciae]